MESDNMFYPLVFETNKQRRFRIRELAVRRKPIVNEKTRLTSILDRMITRPDDEGEGDMKRRVKQNRANYKLRCIGQ